MIYHSLLVLFLLLYFIYFILYIYFIFYLSLFFLNLVLDRLISLDNYLDTSQKVIDENFDDYRLVDFELLKANVKVEIPSSFHCLFHFTYISSFVSHIFLFLFLFYLH